MREINPMTCCNDRSNSPDKYLSINWLIDQLVSNPLSAAPLRRASCWSNVRSSYVFRNLTPDSFRPPQNHSRQPMKPAVDTPD